MNSAGRLDLNLSIAFQWVCSIDRIYKPLCFTLIPFKYMLIHWSQAFCMFSWSCFDHCLKNICLQNLGLKKRLFFTFIYLVFAGIYGVRKQLIRFRILPPCGLQGSNSGHQDWHQAIFPAESSHHLRASWGKLCTAWMTLRNRTMSTMMSAGSL